ncbi:MAG: tetratricopeptide repeat protein [Muribaculaceae bacterium]|nr:tetratricopeptide repeat protein [Muribaculaceae bacterium]
MKRFIHIIIMLAVAISAQAQVIQSINKQNMKFENRDKPEPVKEKPAIDYSIVIDTTTLYFALIDSAQHHINLKQWAVAERFLLDAIKAEPGNPSNSLLLSNLATMQRRQGKLAEAIKNYSMAIDLTPNAVTLLHNRAALYTVVDSIARAQADYERIMELDPADVESRYNHGMIALNLGDSKTAEKDFNSILSINPNSGMGKQGQGYLNKHAGNYDKAAECFSEVIKVRPTSTLLANRADCYLATKRLNDASLDIANALELDPDDPYIYVLRAKLNKLRFNRSDMERDIKLAVAHGLDEKEVKQLLGE